MRSTLATELPGSVVGGKYQIERVLGEGGMGIVVSAFHVHLGQRVALKFLLDHVRHDEQVVERFLREARAAAGLRSEHIGRVIDVDRLDTGAPYMVMELLEGHDLAAELQRVGPLPVGVVADYVLQALVGLAEAHARGIVHRDLKPANLFLTRRLDGTACIKVLDFGIAKATREVAANLTQTRMVMGSPAYMSPEQLRSSRAVDARADLWSIGAIMYELVSGQTPFAGETVTELALQVTLEAPPRLVGLPGGFDEVIYRCLEKDPARRFASAAELAAALVRFGPPGAGATAAGIARVLESAHPVAAVRSGSHAAPTTLQLARSARTAHPAPSGLRGRLAPIALGCAVTCAAVVIAVVVAHGARRGAATTATTASAVGSTVTVTTPLDAGPALGGSATSDAASIAVPAAGMTLAVDAAPTDTMSRDADRPDAAVIDSGRPAADPALAKRRAAPPRRPPDRLDAPEPPAAGSANLEDSRY